MSAEDTRHPSDLPGNSIPLIIFLSTLRDDGDADRVFALDDLEPLGIQRGRVNTST